MIPYSHQSIDDDDIAAVVRVLEGNWLTQGPHVEEFEEKLAARVGARFAVAFDNGTVALHAAAAAAGLGPGDTVVTSPLSFVASANCALKVGATPNFVDIERDTLNLDPALVPPDCDALVAVHFAGLPFDLTRLPARPRVVIEDAAHALGATTPDGPVGNCAHSDMCMFSFHPVKAITTGEGGAITTNSTELANRLRTFGNHGIERRHDQGGWYYEVGSLGVNARLTDMQAALGTSQLGKLDRFLARRRALADEYRDRLAGLPLLPPPVPDPGTTHAYHLFTVQVQERQRVYDALRKADIGAQVHYVPIYRHPLFAGRGFAEADYPVTESVYAGLLSLPLYPDLTEADQDRVIDELASVL